MLQDKTFVRRRRKVLSSDLFTDVNLKSVANDILYFFDNFDSTPATESLLRVMQESGRKQQETDEVNKASSSPIENGKYIEETLVKYVKGVKLRQAVNAGVKLIGEEQYDEFVKSINESVNLLDDEGTEIHLWRDRKHVLKNIGVRGRIVPTGFSSVDDILSGGVSRGTLNVVETPPNKGKTTTLINIGKFAAINGFKVLHYTGELADTLISRRYLMSMTHMTKAEITSKKKTAYDKILEYANCLIDDSIIIKQFATHAWSANDIEAHMIKMNDMGTFPDIVIVDYADLLISTKSYNDKRHELANTYYKLRHTAVKHDIALWTATQTNRGGSVQGIKETDVVGMGDLAECFEKAAVADNIISVNQTIDEKRQGLARIHIAKARDDESGESVTVRVDWTRAWMGNDN